MINLKKETLKDISDSNHSLEDIDYCYIYQEGRFGDEVKVYTKGDFRTDLLNFNYDEGFGGQEVGGFIVFKDGTWLDRREYDGSEWWELQCKPIID